MNIAPRRSGEHRARLRKKVVDRFVRDRLTVCEVADQIGRRPVVVRKSLEEAGICEVDRPLVSADEEQAARSLARRYKDGASIAALTRATGMPRVVIRGMLVSQGAVLSGRHSLTANDLDQVAVRHRAGEEIRELAANFGTSYVWISVSAATAKHQSAVVVEFG
jgi:hypothetical protein